VECPQIGRMLYTSDSPHSTNFLAASFRNLLVFVTGITYLLDLVDCQNMQSGWTSFSSGTGLSCMYKVAGGENQSKADKIVSLCNPHAMQMFSQSYEKSSVS
jgi:hypothetical protein